MPWGEWWLQIQRILTWRCGAGRPGAQQKPPAARWPEAWTRSDSGSQSQHRDPHLKRQPHTCLSSTQTCPGLWVRHSARNIMVSINWIRSFINYFKFKKRETFYYLPTCTECTPIVYCQKTTPKKPCCVVTIIPKTEKISTEQKCWTDTAGSKGLRLNFRRKRKTLWNGLNKVNWTRSFWL